MHKEGPSVQQMEEASMGAAVITSVQVAAFENTQHQQTKMHVIKENWKGIGWCIYAFFICIMFGYDSLAGGVVIGIEAFRKDFGYPYGGDYVVSASWQLGFTTATLGVGGVFMQYFANTPAQFFGAKILTGIPLGTFTTVAPSYASEIAPLPIRGALTAGMNFAIVLGQLLGYGVERQASFYTGKATYRTLFAVQWGFAAVGLFCLPFFPESPYWLVAHNKHEKARKNIIRLHNAGFNVDGCLAEIQDSLGRTQEHSLQGSYLECFNKANWRRTLVAVSVIFIQNACGSSWVIGYMSYFMQLGGLSAAKSFDTTVEWGRRATALYECAVLCTTLLIIGTLACINKTGAIWGQIAFMAVWSLCYQATIGSAAWPIIAENATSRLRAPTQALSTMMNGLSGSIWAFCLPYAINPDQGNLGGKIAFVFGGILVFAVGFIYFLVPETKGRTYFEIDALWNRGIRPRKFAETQLMSVVAADKPDEGVLGRQLAGALMYLGI